MNELWLIEDNTYALMQASYERWCANPAILVEETSTPDASMEIDAEGAAHIKVSGPLVNRISPFLAFIGVGGTTYSSIIDGIASANADPRVKSIVLDVDSPGGMAIDEAYDAADAIARSSKPVEARVRRIGASGAYLLASQASCITVANRATIVGSIGVVLRTFVSKSSVAITNTESPKKAPDLNTEEGKDFTREEMDEHYSIFVDAIAKGRKTTVAKVNAEYGQGSVFLAEKALASGMIDAIGFSASNKNVTSQMKEEELKAQHPDLYASCVKKGTDAERERVVAHLKLGKASGALETSINAIESGAGLTDSLKADYMAAAMNKNEADARQKEADASQDASDPASQSSRMKKDEGDELFAAFTSLSESQTHFG